ncbi:MAG: nitroreductase family protein [Enterobacterales bacterium]|nr:nitroreductase family protein [Enterobacterales bacterium]
MFQPWQSVVISGKALKSLNQSLINEVHQRQIPNPDFDWTPKYQGIHRERQFGAADALYSALSMNRNDKQARQRAMLNNWSFFGAPHVVFFTLPIYLGIMGAVDIGIYAQTLSLLLKESGVDSCMQGALGQFPDPIKKQFDLTPDIGVLFGMSFGYADLHAAANQARTKRETLDISVKFFE